MYRSNMGLNVDRVVKMLRKAAHEPCTASSEEAVIEDRGTLPLAIYSGY